MEIVVHLWQQLPWIIRWPAESFFTVIIIRGMLGNEIIAWLKDKGIFKEGVLHTLYHWLTRLIPSLIPTLERSGAIWEHYGAQHRAASVIGCGQGHCTVFTH